MTRNDISNLILQGNRMSIVEHEGLFYITSFCFDSKEDLAVFYSHKATDNMLICLPSKGKYYIVVSCFTTIEEAKSTFNSIKDDWYDRYFHRITYPTELMFYKDWYDEEYIKINFPDVWSKEEQRMRHLNK